jgi:hypothetical protein
MAVWKEVIRVGFPHLVYSIAKEGKLTQNPNQQERGRA